jgi:hypothetical protein
MQGGTLETVALTPAGGVLPHTFHSEHGAILRAIVVDNNRLGRIMRYPDHIEVEVCEGELLVLDWDSRKGAA